MADTITKLIEKALVDNRAMSLTFLIIGILMIINDKIIYKGNNYKPRNESLIIQILCFIQLLLIALFILTAIIWLFKIK